jgi:hypothetical protein
LSYSGTQCVADCRLGGFDGLEYLAIHSERVELDGEEAETGIERNQDTLRLAIDIDGYGLGAMWLFERGMLHGMTSIGTSLGTAGVLPEL